MTVIGSVYFLVFIFLVMLSVITCSRRGEKYTNVGLFLSFAVLSLLAGFRGSSPDQNTYERIFNEAPSLIDLLMNGGNYDAFNVEWGFVFLLSIIKTLTTNPTVMFLLLACIVIGIVVYACKKLSPYPILSILVYFCWFYYSNLGALRHALVSSLLLLAIVFVVNNKVLKTCFIYITSGLIHKVGLSVLSLYLVKKVKPSKTTLVLFFVVSFVIALFGGVFVVLFEFLSDYLPAAWQNKLDLYVIFSESEGFDTNFSGKEKIVKGAAIKSWSIAFVMLIYFSTLKSKFNEKFTIVFGLYFLSILTLLIFIDFKIVSDRLSNYLAITEILLIPMILSIVVAKQRAIFLFVIVVCMFFQLSTLYGNGESYGQLYPYQFVGE